MFHCISGKMQGISVTSRAEKASQHYQRAKQSIKDNQESLC